MNATAAVFAGCYFACMTTFTDDGQRRELRKVADGSMRVLGITTDAAKAEFLGACGFTGDLLLTDVAEAPAQCP